MAPKSKTTHPAPHIEFPASSKESRRGDRHVRRAGPAAEGATRERIGGSGALVIDWLDAVPLGQLSDRIVAFLRERREDPQALITWCERTMLGCRSAKRT
jgi:hypothetical protein